MKRFLLVLLSLGAAIGDQEAVQAGRQIREKQLLDRGVYVPDPRFNAFVDGVMVNMVREMKKRAIDPLYFRVTSKGEVEHVSTHRRRMKRQEPSEDDFALGGGVVKGLSDIKRFFDASMQIAGNITLVRSSWIMGPLTIIIDYRGEGAINRVKTKMEAVQFDTLTSIDKFGAAKEQFKLYSPLFEFLPYYGNRTLTQQKMTELVVKFLFSENSFLTKYLDEAFTLASFDKIIPQFGAGENYYSVLEYLFNGKDEMLSREARARRFQTFLNEIGHDDQELGKDFEDRFTEGALI